MALENIIQKILSDARLEAQNISKQTDKQITKLQKEHEQQILSDKKLSRSKSKAKAISVAKSMLIASTNEQKNALLKAKKELLDRIFSQSLEKLVSIDDSQYQKLIKKSFDELEKLNLKNIIITPALHKTHLIKNIIEKLAKNYQVSSDENPDIKGGFIASSDQTTLDFSFENLLKEQWPDIEKQLSNLLF